MSKPRKVARLKRVLELSGASKTSIYRWMAAGKFPLAVRLGDHSVAWWEDEIDEWLASRPRAVSLGPQPDPDPSPEAGAAPEPLPDGERAAA